MDAESKFNRESWERFKAIARPFFVSEVRWKASALLLLLALFSISVSGLNVLMSYIGRDFMTALSLKERDEFFQHLYRYLFAFAFATPVVVFYRYTEERLGLFWRRWLSLKMLREYFDGRAYYKLNWLGTIDNPDQRIEEDIRTFCVSTLSFLLIIFNSCIALFAFIGILWSISTTLVLAVVVYATLGSLTAYFLGRPLIGLNFAQLKKEADYRYKLIKVRDNAESIAFFRGEPWEMTRTRQRLKAALQNLLSIINWNRNLNFFTTGYNYLVTILPTVIVAPLYLDGKIEFGVVTQAGFAFAHVLNALSIIVLNFGSLSAFAAVITRLGSFQESLKESRAENAGKGGHIFYAEGESVEFQSVTILTPKRDQLLVKDLSFTLHNSRLLISGPSGSGKSSILRAIASLWTAGEGRIGRPSLDRAIFIPQRPYMIIGTLRSQLVYAAKERGLSDASLEEILAKVGLANMVKRVGGLHATLDWSNVLATGEQQRLSFARLLLAGVEYAFLDEATTALDAESESELYEILKSTLKTYISVGHQRSLLPHHDRVLELKGDGLWTLR